MKKIVIIVPLTPKRLLTPVRLELFEVFLKNLGRVNYSNWEAILIGEEEKVEGPLIFKKIGAESKELKLIYAREYLKSVRPKPDYVLRLDDDDLLNPNLFQLIGNLNFDCYADKEHLFYDLLSGRISFQKRPWLPNTVVHRYECALEEIGENGLTLLQCDHSKIWHKYYNKKKIIYANKRHPVYLRVLSPTTITSQLFDNNSGSRKFRNVRTDVKNLGADSNSAELTTFQNYLQGFGVWVNTNIKDFSQGLIDLEKSNTYKLPDEKINLRTRVLGFFNRQS